jgi:hypothetical protein
MIVNKKKDTDTEKIVEKRYGDQSKKNNTWKARMFAGDYSRPDVVSMELNGVASKCLRPLCYTTEGSGERLAVDYNDAIKNGVSFGMYNIRMYTPRELYDIFGISIPETSGKCFVDDYYLNIYKKPESERTPVEIDNLRYYKQHLLCSPSASARAFWRNMLVWVRKMIQDNVGPSINALMLDSANSDLTKALNESTQTGYSKENLAQIKEAHDAGKDDGEGYSTACYFRIDKINNPVGFLLKPQIEAEFKNQTKLDLTKLEDDYDILEGFKKGVGGYTAKQLNDIIYNIEGKLIDQYKTTLTESSAQLVKEEEDSTDKTKLVAAYSEVLEKSKKPIAVGAVFAPAIFAVLDSDYLYKLASESNYDMLNAITQSAQQPVSSVFSDTNTTRAFSKFITALAAYQEITINNLGKRGEYLGDAMGSYVNEEIYIEAAKNPITYIMHSFYDMVMNDKRGRMLRAFPTFYMMFVDEGREIGLWKLHDNF